MTNATRLVANFLSPVAHATPRWADFFWLRRLSADLRRP